jgi:hypothetical protein
MNSPSHHAQREQTSESAASQAAPVRRHSEHVKLDKFRRLSTEELIDSLLPGRDGSLRARPDGTVLEGHHRLKILRERGVNVDDLQREIIEKDLP